jgi:hypothetical protein
LSIRRRQGPHQKLTGLNERQQPESLEPVLQRIRFRNLQAKKEPGFTRIFADLNLKGKT